jgi:hypothetical protein
MRRVRLVLAVLACGATVLGAVAVVPPGVTEYSMMCNASATVAVGDGLFVVADDEDKDPTPLRLYRVGARGGPISKTQIPENILDLDPGKDAEVDIEGAAPVRERVYWIGSHSAGKNAEERPNRRRLFATRLHVKGDRLAIERAGEPYKHLIRDLDADNVIPDST